MKTCSANGPTDAKRPAALCQKTAAHRCVKCGQSFCLTHLKPAALGCRCTPCYIPDQWSDGGHSEYIAPLLAVATLAEQTVERLRASADGAMGDKGDRGDRDGAAYRDKATRYRSEAATLEIGISMVVGLISGFEQKIAPQAKAPASKPFGME